MMKQSSNKKSSSKTTVSKEKKEKKEKSEKKEKEKVSTNLSTNLLVKEYNEPMTREKIIQNLDKYKTLNSFLIANGCYIRDKKIDHREITHTGMDGFIYHIPMRLYPAVIAFLIRDLNLINPKTYYISELLTEEFKMFGDFDIERNYLVEEKEWKSLSACMQETMLQCYKKNTSAAWFTTGAEVKKTSHGEIIYRYGIHIVWWKIFTNIRFALNVYLLLLAHIKNKLPAPEPPSNSWDEGFDKDVYGRIEGKRGNLRLPGCEKMKPCKKCAHAHNAVNKHKNTKDLGPLSHSKGSRDKEKEEKLEAKINELKQKIVGCKSCGGAGKISLGRPYHPQWIFGEDGKIDEVETAKFQNKWDVGLEIGTLRLPQQTPLTDTLSLPENIPQFYDPLASNVGSSSGTGTSGADSDDERGDGDNSDDDGWRSRHEIENMEKKKLNKKHKHLEKFLSFPQNRNSWDKLSKDFKFRVENENIILMVQSAIREYNENYAEINLLDLRTNKRVRPSTWLCTVDGLGSNYCLNKGKNHTSKGIYFVITMDGNLYHKCHSTRPIERAHGNVCCSVYSSTHRPLPELVREALVWKKKDTGEFKSLDEQLHFQKFENKMRQSRKSFGLLHQNNGQHTDGKEKERKESSTSSTSVESIVTSSSQSERSSMDTINVDEDVKKLNAALSRVKRDSSGLPRMNDGYVRSLTMLMFKHKIAIDGFDKSEMRMDENDIRNLRLTQVTDPKRKSDKVDVKKKRKENKV